MDYKKYLIIGVLNGKENTKLKTVSELVGMRIQHISPLVSDLEKDGYLKKSSIKKKGKRNTKQVILTKKGVETREYFIERKNILGLTWEQMRSYKGPF